MKKLLICGAGAIAEAITYFLQRDSEYEVAAYCCDADFLQSDSFCGKPLLSAESAVIEYSPTDYEMFVALGYQGMNGFRADKVKWARTQGYGLVSYRSPNVPGDYNLGENSIVMDGSVIQPRVSLGHNVFVWGGSMIGHHTVIGDHCWLTGGCAIGGLVSMGERCFVGLNATVGHEISIGNQCMLGANTLVNRSIGDEVVLVDRDTEPHRLNSAQFARMSQCFQLNHRAWRAQAG